MKILAIDTSCDDTCISVLNIKSQKVINSANFEILSNIISSQIKIHQKYGGVYPTLAKREHQRNLPLVLKQSLNKINSSEIDAIAVTIGPGLEPCLWTGVNFAKSLAHLWNIPIIPVNHIEGHIFANFLTKVGLNFQKILPAICLVVSGGHTQLVLMTPVRKTSFSNGASKNWSYKIIGETRDDAAGECFDKTARTLGLSYPGGPSITAEAEKLSTTNNQLSINLPRPMINSKDYDFSFSGLKTAVLYDFKKRPASVKTMAGKPKKIYIRAMAKEIQQAIIDVLIKKTIDAVKEYKVKTIMLGGGVIANKELKKQFKEKIEKEIPNSLFLIPDSILCTDNAAMIGIAGYFNQKKATKDLKKIKVKSNLRLAK